jgi:hypothetical protein
MTRTKPKLTIAAVALAAGLLEASALYAQEAAPPSPGGMGQQGMPGGMMGGQGDMAGMMRMMEGCSRMMQSAAGQQGSGSPDRPGETPPATPDNRG